MGGHYEKDMYKQFCEMAERLNSLEKGSKQDRKEIKRLNKEVDRVNKRNTVLEKKLASQGPELTEVKAENKALKKENKILHEDNERMKRILNNNSDNSSLPPSSDKSNNSCKAANEYNGREKSRRRQGAQAGHKGTTLMKFVSMLTRMENTSSRRNTVRMSAMATESVPSFPCCTAMGSWRMIALQTSSTAFLAIHWNCRTGRFITSVENSLSYVRHRRRPLPMRSSRMMCSVPMLRPCTLTATRRTSAISAVNVLHYTLSRTARP